MSEYFCTNCGATLNEQYGFDPDNGSWSCTDCGQELYGDDVYDGDIYSGVMWYCDQCGVLLNKQNGFSDYHDSWTCSECYHTNPISESEIEGNRKNYSSVNYDDNNDSDNIFEPLIDALFEARKQKRQAEKLMQEEAERILLAKQQEQREKRKRRNKRIKAFIINKKMIAVGASPSDFVGNDVRLAVSYFQNNGFTKVQQIPVKDIFTDSQYQVGEVEQIDLDGSSIFQCDTMFAYDAKIVISYHDKGEIPFPFSPKQVKNMSVQTVARQLKNLGYVNVKTIGLCDLVTGWVKKDGAIKQLTVNVNASYKNGAMYTFDAEIVLLHHSFKNRA